MIRQRAPEGYTYSDDACGEDEPNFCQDCEGTDRCRESYPTDDPLTWGSAETMCRCKPEVVNYTFDDNI